MKHISVFNNFINSTANEHEKEIASRFFSCGMLHAITGESCQVPSLLSSANNKREVPAPYNALTKADIDSLVSIVSSTIANLHEYEREYANDIAFVWDMCDDNKPDESAYNFKMLNALKDERRGIKRQLKRLSAIQHKLKKYR